MKCKHLSAIGHFRKVNVAFYQTHFDDCEPVSEEKAYLSKVQLIRIMPRQFFTVLNNNPIRKAECVPLGAKYLVNGLYYKVGTTIQEAPHKEVVDGQFQGACSETQRKLSMNQKVSREERVEALRNWYMNDQITGDFSGSQLKIIDCVKVKNTVTFSSRKYNGTCYEGKPILANEKIYFSPNGWDLKEEGVERECLPEQEEAPLPSFVYRFFEWFPPGIFVAIVAVVVFGMLIVLWTCARSKVWCAKGGKFDGECNGGGGDLETMADNQRQSLTSTQFHRSVHEVSGIHRPVHEVSGIHKPFISGEDFCHLTTDMSNGGPTIYLDKSAVDEQHRQELQRYIAKHFIQQQKQQMSSYKNPALQRSVSQYREESEAYRPKVFAIHTPGTIGRSQGRNVFEMSDHPLRHLGTEDSIESVNV
uniref:Uncharacterized protein n=1 Tax=Rhabditophanes sp. KR3021 TaxID=114890 RepID=A0AC35TVJ2_9BILA